MKIDIDLSMLKQYEDIFGKEKMLFLFNEYLEKVNTDKPKISELIKENDLNGLRIIYHSLASASLVFGIKNFAKTARKIEELILNGAKIEDLNIFMELGKDQLEDEIKQVKQYLEN